MNVDGEQLADTATNQSQVNAAENVVAAGKSEALRPSQTSARKRKLHRTQGPGSVPFNYEVENISGNDSKVEDQVTAPAEKMEFKWNLGPGTINSDDEVENFSSSDSEAEDEVKYRSKQQGNMEEFYSGFKFESVADYQKDTWDEVLRYMKGKKKIIDMSGTITKVRLREKMAKRIKAGKTGEDDLKMKTQPGAREECEVSDDDSDSSWEDFLPGVSTADHMKLRDWEVQRKEKLMEKPLITKKSEQQLQQEEEDANFFEDAPPYEPDVTFLAMNLSRSLLKAIDRLGYSQPTPIQAATIPVALQGRDICGCAATGTGKTAAYMLPILERLFFKPSEDVTTRVLVLVPTRELGVQVFQVSKELAHFSNIEIALSVGGLDVKSQVAVLKKAPDIVIATPGRLIDHILNTVGFNLDGVEILVLDEADKMLEDCFEEQMTEIMQQCAINRQTMLFSATMTSQVKELALVSLKNPVKVFVNENTDVARNLRQEFVRLRNHQQNNREAVLAYLVTRSFHQHCMVFVSTKIGAHDLNILLTLLGLKSGELHGNLKQNERLITLKKFRDKEIDILVATDVAARGLDIKGVKTVINFNMPTSYSRYVHRVGRTARAGHCGRSISLVNEKEFHMLKEIRKNSKHAMFERVLQQDVFDKYVAKMMKLKPLVQEVLVEEKMEKELRRMEETVATMEKKLHKRQNKGMENEEQERAWFKSKQDIMKAKTQLSVNQGKQSLKVHKKDIKKDQKKVKAKAKETEEDQLMKNVKGWQNHIKKKNRTKRIRSFNQEELQPKLQKFPAVSTNKKVKQVKSSFTKELTMTDQKSVKKLRAGPSYIERKELFEKKNPGKKFNPFKK